MLIYISLWFGASIICLLLMHLYIKCKWKGFTLKAPSIPLLLEMVCLGPILPIIVIISFIIAYLKGDRLLKDFYKSERSHYDNK